MRRAIYLIVIVAAGLAAWRCSGRPMRGAIIETKQVQAGDRATSVVLGTDRVFYLYPEARVDVIVVFDGRESMAPVKEATVGTMLKKLRVLAVTPSVTAPGKSVVMLQAGIMEAQFLEAAAQDGNIWLTLRKKDDQNDHPMAFSSWSKLLGSKLRVLRPARPPQRGGECGPARNGLGASGNGLARAAELAAVENRMREDYPAINVGVPSDQVMFVKAGDRVDVLASVEALDPVGAKKHKLTHTLLQNILVLDNRSSVSEPGQNILLLAMNYDEVQSTALAWDTAVIRILGRNASDSEMYPIKPASLEKW